ncbi:hypothetical protein WT81_33360 [Burkholderia stagnalis]|uniref:hypothetical protein n=1 Tax=Burkholderia stagnalis TaxID=1503054 RepID=UPI00075FD115|nr:hypothetical protein [Burkholderia stagnalis]KWK50428.1 hypothetical protein WT80_00815 [Burkholderia stagnalis]KWK65185.1 hypothetical protein WT81_33360 [Burkholderia stagnalis]KWN76510.1 hypothetical protein WT90_00600 [Burkholderia stagnalis]
MPKLPTFTHSFSDGTVTVVTVHENTDLREFAARRAQQFQELIQLAEDCDDSYRPLVAMLLAELGREATALLCAIAQDEVQRA